MSRDASTAKIVNAAAVANPSAQPPEEERGQTQRQLDSARRQRQQPLNTGAADAEGLPHGTSGSRITQLERTTRSEDERSDG